MSILELIRTILNTIRVVADENGEWWMACLACCAECFVDCLESAVEYFNQYAYIEIGMLSGFCLYFDSYLIQFTCVLPPALYGKSYLKAAQDTWRMFKDRGVDALINDSLVGMSKNLILLYFIYHKLMATPHCTAMTWGAYTVGLLSALGAYVYLHYDHPAYNANGQYDLPVSIFAFIIGFLCSEYHAPLK